MWGKRVKNTTCVLLVLLSSSHMRPLDSTGSRSVAVSCLIEEGGVTTVHAFLGRFFRKPVVCFRKCNCKLAFTAAFCPNSLSLQTTYSTHQFILHEKK
eukprot:NODE_5258_length_418_cov_62.517615_g4579_i0.p2 GENE.NODE_5258_length_418_cov_62.517615_g4579_i0~~NODE_5258_length_418_cov_62.517615_g4579_i0.p2  ORF type:complete len:98 (-),score=7.73 NODE_5258_length_418_cov_62.517615_g4579_i0:37-330(-)